MEGVRLYEKGAAAPIPEDKIKLFKEKVKEYGKSEANSKRNYLLFLIALGTGFRMQDIVTLSIGDLKDAISLGYLEIQERKQYNQWKSNLSEYPNSPKPKKRKVELSEALIKEIKLYTRNKKRSEYAFPSRKGNYITQEYFSKILKSIGKEMQLEKITGHSMRKTYATLIYENTGKDIVATKNAIGHKSIEETRRYIGEAQRDTKKASFIINSYV